MTSRGQTVTLYSVVVRKVWKVYDRSKGKWLQRRETCSAVVAEACCGELGGLEV